jgi:hypothetical protein
MYNMWREGKWLQIELPGKPFDIVVCSHLPSLHLVSIYVELPGKPFDIVVCSHLPSLYLVSIYVELPGKPQKV